MNPARPRPCCFSPADIERRVEWVAEAQLDLENWRGWFARFLAAYFCSPGDYWEGQPAIVDPERLYADAPEGDHIAWTFEVRLHEPVPVMEAAAWTASPALMELLRREVDALPVLRPEMEAFLGRCLCEGENEEDFCHRLERWVLDQLVI